MGVAYVQCNVLATAFTGHTGMLHSGGALMLGGEQARTL